MVRKRRDDEDADNDDDDEREDDQADDEADDDGGGAEPSIDPRSLYRPPATIEEAHEAFRAAKRRHDAVFKESRRLMIEAEQAGRYMDLARLDLEEMCRTRGRKRAKPAHGRAGLAPPA